MGRPLIVLVVDDEIAITGTMERGLHRRGDVVLIANSVTEAWAVLERYNGAVDRAVIDLTLQDGDGLDLATRIHAIYPAIRIILSSGGDIPVVAEFGAIRKPYTLAELWQAIA